jgi:hypothetical protein
MDHLKVSNVALPFCSVLADTPSMEAEIDRRLQSNFKLDAAFHAAVR